MKTFKISETYHRSRRGNVTRTYEIRPVKRQDIALGDTVQVHHRGTQSKGITSFSTNVFTIWYQNFELLTTAKQVRFFLDGKFKTEASALKAMEPLR